MSIEEARRAYNVMAEREWQRLEMGAQNRLEYLVTMHALQQHLPAPGAHILDAGGGPGRYAVALAELRYEVTLLDLSPVLLDIARDRIGSLPMPVRSRIRDVVEGSITDLSLFPDAAFDAVICLGGPLSHLVARDDRRAALDELGRVTVPGGPVIVSVIGRIGTFRSAVQWPDWFDGAFPVVAETGITRINPGQAPCYFFYPEELPEELESAGFEVVRRYGCQGIGAHLDEANLLTLMDDPIRWPQWRDQFLATCDHPAVIGVSNHLMAVARRQAIQ